MLGGGNPVSGANPAGTSSSLNFIGNHVYAQSGSFPDSQTQATMLNFVNGNQYIVGSFTFYGSNHTAQSGGSITSGDVNNFQILIDDQAVGVVKTETSNENSPSVLVIPFLIPPQANIKVKVVAAANEAAFSTQITFVGEVYA